MKEYNQATRRLLTLLSACSEEKRVLSEIATCQVERWAAEQRRFAGGFVGLTDDGRRLLREIQEWDVGSRQIPDLFRVAEMLGQRLSRLEQMCNESEEAYHGGAPNTSAVVHIASKENAVRWLEESRNAMREELHRAIREGNTQQLRSLAPPNMDDLNQLSTFRISLQQVELGRINLTNIELPDVLAAFAPDMVWKLEGVTPSPTQTNGTDRTNAPSQMESEKPKNEIERHIGVGRFYCIEREEYDQFIIRQGCKRVGCGILLIFFVVLLVAYSALAVHKQPSPPSYPPDKVIQYSYTENAPGSDRGTLRVQYRKKGEIMDFDLKDAFPAKIIDLDGDGRDDVVQTIPLAVKVDGGPEVQPYWHQILKFDIERNRFEICSDDYQEYFKLFVPEYQKKAELYQESNPQAAGAFRTLAILAQDCASNKYHDEEEVQLLLVSNLPGYTKGSLGITLNELIDRYKRKLKREDVQHAVSYEHHNVTKTESLPRGFFRAFLSNSCQFRGVINQDGDVERILFHVEKVVERDLDRYNATIAALFLTVEQDPAQYKEFKTRFLSDDAIGKKEAVINGKKYMLERTDGEIFFRIINP
ncbi:hypothetical protein GTO89_02440 [Heliobacterium gestii]|uniref:Uncharacterized protein n=1 Tax=Heliomicrobium gestii TaxID=2699 RepID=A0A845L8H8_HELGE|nr:hypothetical protein [Heliomicrobium gestii]MBM7865641.1 hypothetical protein [Heliomicrobium gestii]MZP41891.1 hypothetical protein [Heliomicrobium gestii]